MPEFSMPAFPVPVFAAAILMWFLIRAIVRREGPGVFLALLALCAGQALITALSLHYGQVWAGLLRPVTAAAIPALAWVAFITTAVRRAEARDLVHLIGPAFVGFCRLFTPVALDLVIPALFLSYGVAILLVLRTGTDGLPRLPLGAGERPIQLWRIVAFALIGSAISDGAIVAAQIAGRGDWVPWIISVASSLSLALVGGLGLAPSLQPTEVDEAAVTTDDSDLAEDEALMARLDEMLRGQQLYLDPDLTLNRLSRRLRVPTKRLSVAINRQTGGNVSRLINCFRIEAACMRLARGDSVTEAMLGSGFNTKSNFNREFLRVIGQSPTAWRAGGILRLEAATPTLTR
jgi:AraC-like DNA-binding protein